MSKWWIALFLFILIFFAFLPKIASTSLGKPIFVKAIEKKSQSQVEIDSLDLSWFGPQKFRNLKWSHEALSGSIEELDIIAPFWSFSGPFQLKNGSISYKGGKIEKIEGQIKGNDFALHGITLQGHLSLQGKIESKLQFNLKIDVKRFPVAVFDPQFAQLLGPAVDLLGTISMDQGKGTVDLLINSANLNTHLKGVLTEHALTLKEALIVNMRLTPEVSRLLLKDANPLFLTGIAAQNPIVLRIEPNGFYFPLPYSLEKLVIGEATLNLGRVKCQNGESLATIISILNADRLSNASEMNTWFTPVSLKIKRGQLEAGRMDALIADSLHVCTWGKIDLLKDQIDMSLGIPSDTLEQTFKLKNLPENYVLTIAVRGTTKDPEIIKGPAIAKIAALIAANQIPKDGVFGGLVDLISKPKEEKGVPAAKRPFPWE
jgi:hypothetical protein